MRMQNAECRMQNAAECGMQRNAKCRDSGSVLMEYVVLCCGIAVALLTFMQIETTNNEGKAISGFYNFEKGYIGLGAAWANHVKILHRAIALPVP